MAEIERARIERLQKKMSEEGLDALVCRLSENVVYLTDYWPHHGFSVAVLPREGKASYSRPEVEMEYTKPAWAEVTPFGWGLLKDGDLYENYKRLLSGAFDRLGLKGKKWAWSAASKLLLRPIEWPSRLYHPDRGRA